MKESINLIENVEITDITTNGKGVGRENNKVVFVDNVLPGDVVDVRVIKKKSGYSEGIAIHHHKKSELRVEPFCSHFGTCGGCSWQQLSYTKQLEFKQKQVEYAFKKFCSIQPEEIFSIAGSELITHYRNKLEYTFSNRKWLTESQIASSEIVSDKRALGFHIPKRFDKILDIQECFLQKDPSNKIRNAVRKYAIENNFLFYDQVKQEGLLRNLIIRTSETNEVMVILITQNRDNTNNLSNEQEALMKFIVETFPEINSLIHINNTKKNDSISDLNYQVYKGQEYIFEKLGNLLFRIGPKSFFQTNTKQAEKLYQITKDFAGLTGNEIVYDLYTGAGSIAIFISENAKKIIGIESVEAAIEDAKINAELNRKTNCKFFTGIIEKILNDDFINNHGKPEIIVTDPPRSGMHPKVIEQILKILPDKIVYVSCNPATQARDVNLLSEKYCIKKSRAVDMFPHTTHVENVVLLERN